ncbi:MAG: bifunctional nuclease family protein, partial [candidate division Zixibacteria bacterium]|nr:bifunctional nuclease family protein [candidate division Zixibacteria bacterium]
TSKRPLTHDLIKSAIELMGGKVEKVEVTQLVNQTFYAKVHIQKNGSLMELDARPSDSIALALKSQAPVFVDEKLFEAKREEMEGKEMGDMESLKERLKRINPEDFGKFSL